MRRTLRTNRGSIRRHFSSRSSAALGLDEDHTLRLHDQLALLINIELVAHDIGLAAKAGHNAEPHNQNDVGSFLIFKNGEELFCDPGPGEYTRQYFSEIRYTIFPAGSQGHSVPMIDGSVQKAGREYAAADVVLDETGISMDMAGAYDLPYMPSLKRDVRFDKATATTLTLHASTSA